MEEQSVRQSIDEIQGKAKHQRQCQGEEDRRQNGADVRHVQQICHQHRDPGGAVGGGVGDVQLVQQLHAVIHVNRAE